MNKIDRRDVLLGFAAAGLMVEFDIRSALAAEPVTLRLGYGRAAEEQVWLLLAKPDIGKYQGKVYKLDATQFRGSDKRAQAFAAGAIDLAEGSATGMMSAAAEGLKSKIIASICRESKKGFSTSFYVQDSSPIKSVVRSRPEIRRTDHIGECHAPL
jgi:ABC-type nitrate/sulfonate/bicarbonate transport system substrate-binding protein